MSRIRWQRDQKTRGLFLAPILLHVHFEQQLFEVDTIFIPFSDEDVKIQGAECLPPATRPEGAGAAVHVVSSVFNVRLTAQLQEKHDILLYLPF